MHSRSARETLPGNGSRRKNGGERLKDGASGSRKSSPSRRSTRPPPPEPSVSARATKRAWRPTAASVERISTSPNRASARCGGFPSACRACRYARLEPLSAAHCEDLFRASSGEGAQARRNRSFLSRCALRIRRVGLPALRVEMQLPERALQGRGAPVRIHLRRGGSGRS